MGLFSKKDKDKKKEVVEENKQPQQQQQQQSQQHPDLLHPTPTAPPPKETNTSTNPAQQTSQNSWQDSTYQSYNSSNVSEEPQIRKQQEQRLQGHPPGTTVTTTTTTTTTVTTVSSDGRVHTQTFPYNPNIDPPVRTSETTSADDSSRARSIGGSSNTATTSNPSSTTNIPTTQTQSNTQTSTSTQLAPGPHGPERPEVQRTISPARKPTPQELDSDTHFNIIPPTPQGSLSSKNPKSPANNNGSYIPPRSERRVSPRTSFGANNAVQPEPDFMPDGPLSPGPPMRSEKRNSFDRGLNVQPLKTSNSPSRSGSRPVSSSYGQPLEQTYSGRSSYEAPPHPPPKDEQADWHQRKQQESEYANLNQHPLHQHPAERSQNQSAYNTNNNSATYIPHDKPSYETLSPTSPTNTGFGTGPHSRSHTPSNLIRPGPGVTSPSASQTHFNEPPTSAQAMHAPTHTDEYDSPTSTGTYTTITANNAPAGAKPHHYRQSFTQTMKGIQGASDVIRGTVNSNIAKVTREKEEAEKQRAIREKGLADYRASGLNDQMRGWAGRVPVGQQRDGSTRLRKRSLSRNGVHGSEGPQGLEPVEERSINSQ